MRVPHRSRSASIRIPLPRAATVTFCGSVAQTSCSSQPAARTDDRWALPPPCTTTTTLGPQTPAAISCNRPILPCLSSDNRARPGLLTRIRRRIGACSHVERASVLYLERAGRNVPQAYCSRAQVTRAAICGESSVFTTTETPASGSTCVRLLVGLRRRRSISLILAVRACQCRARAAGHRLCCRATHR